MGVKIISFYYLKMTGYQCCLYKVIFTAFPRFQLQSFTWNIAYNGTKS